MALCNFSRSVVFCRCCNFLLVYTEGIRLRALRDIATLHICIIAVLLLTVFSASPIMNSMQSRRHLTSNTREVPELETLSSATTTAVTQVIPL